MKRVSRTLDELKEKLEEHLQFLQRSADSFDVGFEDEALRLANSIRVLCHDTKKSHSLLNLLEIKDTTVYLDTSVPFNPANRLSHSGLVCVALREARSEPRPLLDGGLFARKVSFDDWWNGVVFVDNQRTQFSRKDLVLFVANQDGGAHVDPSLDEDYARLTRDNSLGWFDVRPPGKPVPAANQVPAAVRQIAHELLKTFRPDYRKDSVKKKGDGVYVMSPTSIQGFLPLPFPNSNPVKSTTSASVPKPKIGRNKPCPCGSGKKFKKYCGK